MSRLAVIGAVVAAAVLGGVGAATAQQSNGGSGPLVTFAAPGPSLTGRAIADVNLVDKDGSTTWTLAVRGLDAAPGTSYEARLHIGLCNAGDPAAAGRPYADTGSLIVGSSGTVSLPFVVSAIGTGAAQATVPFVVPAGHANSLVFSDAKGSPVACLRVTINEPAPVESPDQVLGVTQTPADATPLAFTGSESSMLAVAGFGLIAVGAVVLGGRRHLHDRH